MPSSVFSSALDGASGRPVVITSRSTEVLFRVTGPGNSRIELRPKASGTSRKSGTGHGNMEQLNRALVDYGATVIAPVLVPRLCQQVVSGAELKVGRLTISQAGLTKQGVFGVKTLAWPDFYGTGNNNGRVILFRRKAPDGRERKFWPWFKVDMSVTNGIVLPSVLPTLYRYFTGK